MNLRTPSPNLPLMVLILVFAAALVTFAVVGLFTRYMADDYCMAVGLRNAGFFKMQLSNYFHWTGRVSFTFLVSLAGLAGPRIVPFLPLTALLCWVLAAVWLVYEVAQLTNVPRPLLTALLFGELIVFATLTTAHNLVQSFYWQSGMLTYTPPLVLGTFYLAIVARGLRRRNLQRWKVVLLAAGSFVITAVAGAFSETYIAVQTTALVIALVIVFRLRGGLVNIISGLAGTLVALVVILPAPGNAVRRAFFPPAPGVPTLVIMTLNFTYRFMGHTVLQSPLSLLLMVTGPALLALYLYRTQSRQITERHESIIRRSLWLLPFVTGFLIAISFVPGVYGTSADPPWRSRFIPQFVLVVGIVAWSFLAGVFLSSRRSEAQNDSRIINGAAMAGFALMILWALLVVRHNVLLIPHARANAQQWDQTDAEIRAVRATGVKNVIVRTIDDMETSLGGPWNELQVQSDEQKWKNRCLARYYDVDSIVNVDVPPGRP